MVKNPLCQYRRPRFDPWVGKVPWRRKWQPTPVLVPGQSHGQRSLVGYSPWGHKVSDMTEHACAHKRTRPHISYLKIPYAATQMQKNQIKQFF